MLRFIILFCFGLSTTYAQEFDSVRIAQCTSTHYDMNYYSKDSGVTYSKYYHGLLLADSIVTFKKKTVFNSDTSRRIYIAKYSYDSKGNQIYKRVLQTIGTSMSLIQADSSRFDAKGNLIYHSEYLLTGNSSAKRIIFQYDIAGNKILEDRQYTKNGTFISEITYMWTFAFKSLISYQINYGDTPVKLEKYEYDDKGYLWRTTSYDWKNSKWENTQKVETYYDVENRDSAKVTTSGNSVTTCINYYNPLNKPDSIVCFVATTNGNTQKHNTKLFYNISGSVDSIVYNPNHKDFWTYNQEHQVLTYRNFNDGSDKIREDFIYSISGKILLHKYRTKAGCGCYEELYNYDSLDQLIYSKQNIEGMHTFDTKECSYTWMTKKPTPSVAQKRDVVFEVYPNPSEATFYFNTSNRLKGKLKNKLGQELKFYNFESGENLIDLNHLSSGIYFLEVQNNTERKVVKLVKN